MALTAPQIRASIYAIDRGFGIRDIPGAFNGRANIFVDMAQLKFYPAPLGTTANGVTMNAIIEELPTGLRVNSTKYYTDSTAGATGSIVSNGA